MMKNIQLVVVYLIFFFCCVLKVYSKSDQLQCTPPESVPYITFMGTRLHNNSFVSVNELDSGEELQCHTDLNLCCNNNGPNTGNWLFPNGSQITNTQGYRVMREEQQVSLQHPGAGNNGVTGIFQCSIATNANGPVDSSQGVVLVGIYDSKS